MKVILPLLFLFILLEVQGQEKSYVPMSFKDTRIVNGQSVETNPKGQLKFVISHRFGSIKGGIEEFFGLDQAIVRLGLDYGISDRLTVGIGRSSNQKTVDGFAKYRLLKQTTENEMPISLSLLASMAVRTLDLDVAQKEYPFSSKLFYTYQALLARQFSDRFALQLMPTLVHRNLVEQTEVSNDVFAVGAASRFQLTKMISWQVEYYYTLPDQLLEVYNNSLSMGFDIETKSHVFQLHISNSQGMIEKFFVGETRGSWEDGIIFFGFNISRDFQLGGRKYK
ncbi:MAG: DUF5777 family beta-barrel protein [Vicingaceae bacterium]